MRSTRSGIHAFPEAESRPSMFNWSGSPDKVTLVGSKWRSPHDHACTPTCPFKVSSASSMSNSSGSCHAKDSGSQRRIHERWATVPWTANAGHVVVGDRCIASFRKADHDVGLTLPSRDASMPAPVNDMATSSNRVKSLNAASNASESLSKRLPLATIDVVPPNQPLRASQDPRSTTSFSKLPVMRPCTRPSTVTRLPALFP